MWSKNRFLGFFVLGTVASFAFFGVAKAFTETSVGVGTTTVSGNATTIAPSAIPAVSSASFDFGVENPGILPISPLYFLKEWRRDLVRSITTDPSSRTSLEFSVLNEKAAEVQGVVAFKPDNEDGIALSIDVYRDSLDRVKTAVQNLVAMDTSDLDATFLGNISREVATHVAFFAALGTEYRSSTPIVARTAAAQQELQNIENAAVQEADSATLHEALASLFPEKGEMMASGTAPTASSTVREELYRMIGFAAQNAATSTRDTVSAFFMPHLAASSSAALATSSETTSSSSPEGRTGGSSAKQSAPIDF